MGAALWKRVADAAGAVEVPAYVPLSEAGCRYRMEVVRRQHAP